MVFERQVGGVDQVLGEDMSFGLGYGLSSSYAPVGPRTCFWGGYGGSIIMMDQELGLTVSYMMNKMRVGLTGDTRGSEISLLAAVAAMS
jgi:CubicO group peptidase (beta-lactamase class C family)